MRVQVIEHHPDLLCPRVSGIRQPAHLMGEVSMAAGYPNPRLR